MRALCRLVCCFLLVLVAVNSEAQDGENFVFSLPELTIDAERATYQSLISRPQDEIGPEKIVLMQKTNPVDLLWSFNPSIHFSHSLLGAITTPEMRGFDGKYTKVMLDGTPLNTPWNGSSQLSGFPLRRLKKVSVVSGGSALVYGSSALGGAVNLTLPGAKDLEGLTFVQEYGSMGTRHQEFLYGSVAHQNEHLFGVFQDEYSGNKNYKTYGIGGDSSKNLMYMYRGRVKTDSGYVLKATLLESSGEISIPNYMQRFEPWEMSHRDLVVEKSFANDSNLSFRYAYYRDYSRSQLYTDYSLKVASGPVDPADDVTVTMTNLEALYNLPVGKRHFLTFGAQKQSVKDEGHTVKGNVANKWLNSHGFFISDAITASQKLDLQLIARLDESFAADSEFSWSVGGDYKLDDNTSFGGGVSRTLRFPNVQELYRGTRVLGNENLEPEKSLNYELRLRHFLNDAWEASLTRYVSKVDNKITTAVVGAPTTIAGVGTLAKNDSYYRNLEEAEIEGWEFALNGAVNDNLDAWLGYTVFERVHDSRTNLRLVAKPDFRVTGGAAYHRGKFAAMLTCMHQGKTPGTQTIDSSGRVTQYDKVAATTLLDLGLRHQLSHDCSIYINIENLADKNDAVLIQGSDLSNKFGLLRDPLVYNSSRKTLLGMELKF